MILKGSALDISVLLASFAVAALEWSGITTIVDQPIVGWDSCPPLVWDFGRWNLSTILPQTGCELVCDHRMHSIGWKATVYIRLWAQNSICEVIRTKLAFLVLSLKRHLASQLHTTSDTKRFFCDTANLESSTIFLRRIKKLWDSLKNCLSMNFLSVTILGLLRFLVNPTQIENLNTQNLIPERAHSFFDHLGMHPERSVYREKQFDSSFSSWVPPKSCATFRNMVIKRFRRSRSHTTIVWEIYSTLR